MKNSTIYSTDEYLALYPWPQDLQTAKKFDVLMHFDLEVQPEQLWPYIINTNQLNKDLGFPVIEYSEENGALIGKAGKGDYFQSWLELPWEWNYCQSLSRYRYFTAGPLQYNRISTFIQKIDEKNVRLYVYIGSIGSHPAAEKVMAIFFEKFASRYAEVFRGYEQEILHGAEPEHSYFSQEHQDKLNKCVKAFQDLGLNWRLAKKFFEYIFSANEIDLYRIRILSLANLWKVDKEELLEICLYAVKLGFLLLTWDTICPHCRGPRSENPYLAEVPINGKCDVCKIEFDNNTENSIEVVFHVHPSLREIKKIYYCSGEAHEKQHIKLQQYLQKKTDEINVQTNVPHAKYRSRIIGDADVRPFIKESTQTTETGKDHWEFKLKNPFDNDKIFVLENLAWDQRSILRPAMLFNNTVFRELFPDETMPLDLNLEIGKQTIMLIDISHSSDFYLTFGDINAFKEIRKIFVYLSELAKKFHGAVFKTMGDGCLISFNSPNEALNAMLYLEHKKAQLETTLSYKISIHTGNCLAVNFNNKIDYFGNIINFVSKIQYGADAGDIIISETLLNEEHVQKHLKELNIDYSDISIHHPSMNAPIHAYKLKINA